jgi:hypothetical protein
VKEWIASSNWEFQLHPIPHCVAFCKRDDPERCIGTIRIEQGSNGRGFEFEMPRILISNLLWFHEMKSLKPAQHLRSWMPNEARPLPPIPPAR